LELSEDDAVGVLLLAEQLLGHPLHSPHLLCFGGVVL
jgi:hypothetical protein